MTYDPSSVCFQIDSYGGSLRFKVRYTLARGLSEPVEKPDVIIVGNGRRLVYRRGSGTPAQVANQKVVRFTEVGLGQEMFFLHRSAYYAEFRGKMMATALF